MNNALIAFGSNLGDRLKNLNNSIELLSEEEILVVKYSDPIMTAPQNMHDKSGDFLNTVLSIRTRLNPFELLNCLKKVDCKNDKRHIHYQIKLCRSKQMS